MMQRLDSLENFFDTCPDLVFTPRRRGVSISSCIYALVVQLNQSHWEFREQDCSSFLDPLTERRKMQRLTALSIFLVVLTFGLTITAESKPLRGRTLAITTVINYPYVAL